MTDIIEISVAMSHETANAWVDSLRPFYARKGIILVLQPAGKLWSVWRSAVESDYDTPTMFSTLCSRGVLSTDTPDKTVMDYMRAQCPDRIRTVLITDGRIEVAA